MELNKDNLVERMITLIPETTPLYKKEIEWWGNEIPGLHNILGNVLNPYILSIKKTIHPETQKNKNHQQNHLLVIQG